MPHGSGAPSWNALAAGLAAIHRVVVQVMSLFPAGTVGTWNNWKKLERVPRD